MIPGMRGMSPKKLQQMMKQMGIDVEQLENVEKVIIQLSDKELIFEDVTVTVMKAQGTKNYQISGEPTERARINEEDVRLVTEQAGVNEDDAREALAASDGDLAEAILKLKGPQQQ
ncbi:MAG: nascent polypeptide-associated complex protein [Halobacteriota archaeon]|jgi:nascent polypeptide-associated complex subunit alpha